MLAAAKFCVCAVCVRVRMCMHVYMRAYIPDVYACACDCVCICHDCHLHSIIICSICYSMLFAVIGVFVLFAHFGGEELLFCSHRTLLLSIQEPSPFSQAMGNVIIIV